MNHHKQGKEKVPRVIAWEITRQCPMNCLHCRAGAENRTYDGELSFHEATAFIDNLASFCKPVLILTGGEPMAREDIYDIARYAVGKGFPVAMAPCGLYITHETVAKIKDAGIRRISLSLDGVDRETHDAFRGYEGSFEQVVKAARIAREGGLEFQINTTVTKHNYKQLKAIFELSLSMGAAGYHPFLLVPTGRGKNLSHMEISPAEYETVLTWIYEKSFETEITLKPTCAPHYYRIFRQKEKAAGREVSFKSHGMNAMTRGCLGGHGFAFVSFRGAVQLCGFLDIPAGDLREEGFDFKKIWNTSNLFNEIRNKELYKGKCGSCSYWHCCGGCRARGHSVAGDYMAPEPYCVYTPVKGEGYESKR